MVYLHDLRKKALDYIEKHPDSYLRELAKVFETSVTAIFKACKRFKITLKKPPFYKERDEEKRKRFLEAIKNIPEENRVYIDESGINKYLYRQYGRAQRGEEVYGAISGHRYHRKSFIAAQNKSSILAPFCYTGSCNTTLFNTWLKKILIPELTPGQIFILDNASFHKSKESIELIENAGCKVLFPPPYSPDLNPIEKFWANFKKKVQGVLTLCANLAEAIDRTFLEYYAQ